MGDIELVQHQHERALRKYGGARKYETMALQVVTFPVMPIVRTHLIVNCVITFLALVVVALRLVSRFITNAKLWWDDYFVLMAVPMGIGMLVIQGLCR